MASNSTNNSSNQWYVDGLTPYGRVIINWMNNKGLAVLQIAIRQSNISPVNRPALDRKNRKLISCVTKMNSNARD
ncbi:MAG: hypothetical protein MJK04_06370 [Psychrosphaera sp.]|nr:hypothetical protein [Psychrosphaera sp.]